MKQKRKTKAVILAAGASTRFFPFSEKHHKSFFKIAGKTIIERIVGDLVRARVKDIIILHLPEDKELYEKTFSKKLGIKYVPYAELKGTGHGLMSTLDFVESDFILVNATHTEVYSDVKKILKGAKQGNIVIAGAKSERPWEYAVIRLNNKIQGKIDYIVEKPEKGTEHSDIRTVGVYFLPLEFKKYLLGTEYSYNMLINAINSYIKDLGGEVVLVEREPVSIKYAFDILNAILDITNSQKRNISKKAKISKKATINGNVVIGDNVVIKENAVIHGPVYIGKNCIIGNNVVIRENTVIEDDVVLGVNTEVKRSYIGQGTHIHSGYIGDSVIGENCRIGAGFISANRRIDRKEIKFSVNGKVVESRKTYLGCIIGHDAKIGINASTMPGTIIGSNCIIGSNTEVKGTIDSNSTVYSKSEVVIKKNE